MKFTIVHASLTGEREEKTRVFHDGCKIFDIKYMICSFQLTECNHYLDHHHHHHPYGYDDIGLSRWHRMQMSIFLSVRFVHSFEFISFFFSSVVSFYFFFSFAAPCSW